MHKIKCNINSKIREGNICFIKRIDNSCFRIIGARIKGSKTEYCVDNNTNKQWVLQNPGDKVIFE